MAFIEPTDPFLKGKKRNCVFCHQPAVAYWHCRELELCVCQGCATQTTPLLMADAVIAHDPKANLDAVLKTVSENFYRGAAMGLQRLHRPDPPEDSLET